MLSPRQFFSHRLIWLALLLSLGIGGLFAHTIWTGRTEAWDYAARTNINLVRTLERGVSWSLDSIDKSLEGVVREIGRKEVWALPPDLRHSVIFDESLRTRGAGDMLVLDALGQVVLDSGALVPRQASLADRDYFQAFANTGREGLFIGKPVSSRVDGSLVLPLARPYQNQDGDFAGVVVGSIRLAYLNDLFGALDLGPSSGINMLRGDGTVISRFPYGDSDVGTSLAGTPNMLRFQRQREGVFEGRAAIDGVERIYAFRQVGQYPLIINVAQSVETLLGQWRRDAWVMGGFALLLMLSCLGMAALFVHELTLRKQVSAQLRMAEHDLRTILNNLPSAIGYWDDGLRNRFANEVMADWCGVTPARLRGMHASTLMGPVFERNLPYMERALAGQRQVFELTMKDKGGQQRHVLVSYLPDEIDGKVHGFFVQATDLTERKRMEDELFAEKERVRLTLQSIGDAVVCADAAGAVTYLNPVAERLTGWQAFDAAGRPIDEVVRLLNPHSGEVIASSLLQAAIPSGAALAPVRGIIVHRASGQRFQVEETASPITDRHGQVTGGVAVLRDVTEAVAMAERMAHMAHYDPLTDLPNRVLLHDRAQLAIRHALRDDNQLAVMYLDLDGFKAVNDSLGHDVGDELLVQFSQRLKAAVRASDTVCRQGGDEFVVLLPGLVGPEPARAVARKILATCDAPFALAGRSVRIGLSGGIALYPQHGDTFDALSRHADSAMYAAKRAGRMRFMLYAGPDAPGETVEPEAPPQA